MAAMTLALAQQAGASGVEGGVSAPRSDVGLERLFEYGLDEGPLDVDHRTLLVRTTDGWSRVELAVPHDLAVLPSISRSEVVVRPELGPDGIEIATIEPADSAPATLTVRAFIHTRDQQLVQVDGELVLLNEVAPPTGPVPLLEDPLSHQGPRHRWKAGLDLLLRRDGLMLHEISLGTIEHDDNGWSLVAVGPRRYANAFPAALKTDHRWVALAGPLCQEIHGTDDPRIGLDRLRSTRGEESMRPADVSFDQAYLAIHLRPSSPAVLEAKWRKPLEIPAGLTSSLPVTVDQSETRLVVRAFDPIETPVGSTITYVVSLERPGGALGLPLEVRSSTDERPTVLGEAPGLWWAYPNALTVHSEGPDEQLDIRPTMGPGAAWGDVDLDGWSDLYVVQGRGREGLRRPSNRLFANAGGFIDVTHRWGGADTGAGMGALFFDADGDRDLDLYVANYGADVLFDNRMADGVPNLVDVSATAGVGGDLWSAGICAGDVDNDGDLDLYVTSYLEYDESQMPSLEDLPYQREDPVAMLPFAFPGQRNVLLINESTADGLRFVDRAKEWRVIDQAGRGMQPIMFDFDRDGWLDLYVANDVSPNVLYKNNGDGRMRDVSFATGMDDPRGGMGVAIGDVDLDGDEDLFLTNWELEANALYVSNLLTHSSQRHRVATFRDGIVNSGLGPHGIGVTSWAAVLFDLENDGDLDLYVANGYTSPDYESTGICVAQPDHLFTNDGRGTFAVAHDLIAPFAANGGRDLPSRCAIDCDFDRDGDVDLFVTANNSAYRLLENTAERQGHWLGVRLSAPAPNTYAIGARVEVVTDRRTFVRTLLAGSGYLGGNAPELHFGLGTCERLERVVVHPPGRNAANDGPASPVTFTPADTDGLALDTWVTLNLPE